MGFFGSLNEYLDILMIIFVHARQAGQPPTFPRHPPLGVVE